MLPPPRVRCAGFVPGAGTSLGPVTDPVPALFPDGPYEAQGLVLRSYDVGDGAALHEAVQESIDHLRPWLAWPDPQQTPAQAEALVRSFRARWLLGEDFTAGVWSPAGRFLGGTGFHLRGRSAHAAYAEIGMWVRVTAAGAGVGTRALAAMISWAWQAWPWQRLEWRCDTANTGSRRVAERNGMRWEGTLRADALPLDGSAGRRDTHVFGLLRTDSPD